MAWRFKLILLLASTVVCGCVATSLEQGSQRRQQIAQARLRLGLAYLEQGDQLLARQNIAKALKNAPNDYRVHLATAFYLQRSAEYDAAKESYRQAVALAPRNAVVRNNYGAFLCHLGQYIEAQQQFYISADLWDGGVAADSLEYAGYCYLKAGQYDDAKILLIRWLKSSPDKSKALLITAEHYLKLRKSAEVKLLLDIHQQTSLVTAERLWLQIRLAALEDRRLDVQHYGEQLRLNFSQSEQNIQFLTNEY